MLEICLLGTGGTMPFPDRPLTALMVRWGGHNLLIDCGEGTQVQIRKKKWSMRFIDHILITHLHGDHILGLPGLLMSIGKDGRTEPLEIIGPAGLSRAVSGLMLAASELPFPLQLTELHSPEETFFCNGLRICAFEAEHSVTCYGYSLHADRARKFDRNKAAALEIPQRLWGRLQKGETVDGFTPDMVLGEPRKGLHLVYVTDSRPTERLRHHAENADLLICEGMYGDDEKQEMAAAKKHMLFSEAARLAQEAGAARLWLTHFSPSLDEPEACLEGAKAIFPATVIPQPLMTEDLKWTTE